MEKIPTSGREKKRVLIKMQRENAGKQREDDYKVVELNFFFYNAYKI